MWNPPGTRPLKAQVPYRPLEARFLCSDVDDVIFNPHGIHLELNP